ncbi:high mobility group box domain-containing protein, partial [Coprinopsis sp. MPI-PUGE-AT-0042]
MPAIRNPPPPKKKSHSRAHPPGYIPRPRNAFFIFRSAFYKSHKEDDDDSKINQQDLSKQVAIIWNEMNEDEREPFVLQAEEEKRRHAEMYPGYIYAPN